MCISGRHRSRFVQIGIYFGVGGRSAYPTFSRALCMIPLIVANKDKNMLMFFLKSALFWSVMFDSGVALLATEYHRHALVFSRDYHDTIDTRYSVPTLLTHPLKETWQPGHHSLVASPQVLGGANRQN